MITKSKRPIFIIGNGVKISESKKQVSAAEKIQEAAKVGRSTAYNYLSLDGVYAEHLEFNESDQKLHLNLFIKD